MIHKRSEKKRTQQKQSRKTNTIKMETNNESYSQKQTKINKIYTVPGHDSYSHKPSETIYQKHKI